MINVLLLYFTIQCEPQATGRSTFQAQNKTLAKISETHEQRK